MFRFKEGKMRAQLPALALLICLALASLPGSNAMHFDDEVDVEMWEQLQSSGGDEEPTNATELTINSNCRRVGSKECEYFGLRDGTVRWNENAGYYEALMVPSGNAHHASQLMLRHPPEHPWRWELHCAWFSGSEGKGTVSIAHTKMERFSNQWTDSREVATNNGRSAQNPVFLWDNATDTIHLLHTSQRGPDQGTSRIQEVTSTDGGDRWSRIDIIYDKEGTFLRNHPIRALDGAWLLPVYHTPKGLHDHKSQYSEMMRSEDDGKTWNAISIMAPPPMALVQPTVVRLANNSLVAFFRDRRDVAIAKTISHDDGYTWERPWRTVLPNPNKAVQALRLQSGAIAILFDNQKGAKTRTHRKLSPMTIALSYDNGTTWPYAKDLEDNYDQTLEYAYPSMVQDPQGFIHLTYTYAARGKNRIGIRYIKIWESWVKTPWKSIGFTIGEYQPPPPPPPAPESPPAPPQPSKSLPEELPAIADVTNSTNSTMSTNTTADPEFDSIGTVQLVPGFLETVNQPEGGDASADLIAGLPQVDKLTGAEAAPVASVASVSVAAAAGTAVPGWAWAVLVIGVVGAMVALGVIAYTVKARQTKLQQPAAAADNAAAADSGTSAPDAKVATVV